MPDRKPDHPAHLLLGKAVWATDLHGVGTVTPEGGKDGPSAQERLDQHGFFRIPVGGARNEITEGITEGRITEGGVGVLGILLQAADAQRYVRPRAAGEEPDQAAHASASGDENDVPGTDRSEHVLGIGRGPVRFDVLVQPGRKRRL